MTVSSFNSIRARLTFASLMILPFLLGVLGWTLHKAYSNSLLESQSRNMIQQIYALIASAELSDGQLWLPEQLTDDRLNQLSSNNFAVVYADRAKPVWYSLSATDKLMALDWQPEKVAVGSKLFSTTSFGEDTFFAQQFTVAWESENSTSVPFVFTVFESDEIYETQVSTYLRTLGLWLTIITLILIAIQLLILKWGFSPIKNVIRDLSALQRGESKALEGPYPKELRPMADSINQLIEHEISQRERYRNKMADLAHSIKNPVTIISGSLREAEKLPADSLPHLQDIKAQNSRINEIISYQLKSAVGQAKAPFHQAIALAPECQKVISALNKVYVDKAFKLESDVPDELVFRGDQGDLLELLGNLMDNAFKYGDTKISIHANGDSQTLNFLVENDGPSLTEAQRKEIIRRGHRADTQHCGQGIGLAVVQDIVDSYHGSISLEESRLGGLKVSIHFQWPTLDT